MDDTDYFANGNANGSTANIFERAKLLDQKAKNHRGGCRRAVLLK